MNFTESLYMLCFTCTCMLTVSIIDGGPTCNYRTCTVRSSVWVVPNCSRCHYSVYCACTQVLYCTFHFQQLHSTQRGAPPESLRGPTFTLWGCYGLCFWQKPTELARSFLFTILFHKFSWQLSVFLLCSSGLISALLVRSITHLLIKVSFSLDIILCGWLGLKHQLTN